MDQAMTPETIAATVRQHNPFIQGRRNELRRLRDKLDASSVSNPAEVAATDAELAKWEKRAAEYETPLHCPVCGSNDIDDDGECLCCLTRTWAR